MINRLTSWRVLEGETNRYSMGRRVSAVPRPLQYQSLLVLKRPWHGRNASTHAVPIRFSYENIHVRLHHIIIHDLLTKTQGVKLIGNYCWSSNFISSKMTTRPYPLDEESTANMENEQWVKRIKLDPMSEQSTERVKFKMFVLLLSYSGKGYYGMQRNHGIQTIEGELLQAMAKANLISQKDVEQPQILRFQRACRTDKGVSAVRQIVSCKLPRSVEDISGKINEQLPETIRVMKVIRATQKFDAKLQCDNRTYSYLTPTFAFCPKEEVPSKDYRVPTDVLERLQLLLNMYLGTHNFYNFTSKVKYSDTKANRYIISFTHEEPFVRDGIEWVLIKIKGQSFMLHQIRKMIGLVIAILRGFAKEDAIDKAQLDEKMDVPIAPSYGLLLEEAHYSSYNKKFGDTHDKLQWDDLKEELEKFREKYILADMIQTEVQDNIMLEWLDTLNYHCYESSEKESSKETFVDKPTENCHSVQENIISNV